MKLSSLYNLVTLSINIILFFSVSVVFIYLLRTTLIGKVDDNLRIEQQEITNYVNIHHRLMDQVEIKDMEITFQPFEGKMSKDPMFSTISIPNTINPQNELLYRQLSFPLSVNEKKVEVSVCISLENTNALVKTLTPILLGTLLLTVLLSILISRVSLFRLWRPFYATMGRLKDFKLENREFKPFPDSRIDEFDRLNKTLNEAISQAQEDYVSLKEFTENASHELQTPIAIIQSKIDNLIQDKNLSILQGKELQETNDVLQRMAKLNKSLLLLTKIDNHQFTERKNISLPEIIAKKLSQFEDILAVDSIKAKVIAKFDFNINFNPFLLDIMLNNLFENAIRHNYLGGNIAIEIKNHYLIFRNTGIKRALDSDRIFKRFYKDNSKQDNNGLGLAIIERICKNESIAIEYQYEEGWHTFVFHFLE